MRFTLSLRSRISPLTTTEIYRLSLREALLIDRGRHVRDAAHLAGEVGGHRVHAVGEVLPGAGHVAHVGLAAELALGADLARHARHFGGERAQLIHHAI